MAANDWYSPPPLGRPGQGAGGRTEVGVVAPNYGLEHLSYLMDVPGYRHVLLRRVPLHRLERRGTFWDKTPVFLRAPVPLMHTFNHLPMNGPPFVLSFEMELPFYLGQPRAWQLRLGHRLLASRRCRAILCLSETYARQARAKFEVLGLPEVAAKIGTFRGAVVPSRRPHPAEDGWSREGEPLRLLFVGADALRKGLVPLLEAVEELRRAGAEIELTVISSVTERSYAVPPGAGPSAAELRRRLAGTPWIRHHPGLPYAEVRAAMGTHDLLLLPSLDETLGWVVIEAAMEGRATVATDIAAMPELVEDGVSGRLVGLPLNAERRWRGLFEEDRPAAYGEACEGLRAGLVAALGEVLERRALARAWGAAAHARLAPLYDPARAAAELAGHYDRALGRAPDQKL